MTAPTLRRMADVTGTEARWLLEGAAHYRRTLPGWAYGPHDTLLRITPQTVSGHRLGTMEQR